jgi:alpha-tubulin suppressor-like RCC1 family protein
VGVSIGAARRRGTSAEVPLDPRSTPPCPYPLVDGLCPVPCESISAYCSPDGAPLADAAVDGNDATSDGAADARVCDGGPCVTQVAVGDHHACALMSDRTVRCWGESLSGQLGDSTLIPGAPGTLVASLTNVTQLVVGGAHSCALMLNGGVACWGENAQGQVGDGTLIDRTTPAPVVGLTDAIQIATGLTCTCAVSMSGGASCGGDNSAGQLGTGDTTIHAMPAPVAF